MVIKFAAIAEWGRKTHVKRPKSLELPHWKPRGTKRARKPAPGMKSTFGPSHCWFGQSGLPRKFQNTAHDIPISDPGQSFKAHWHLVE